MHGDKHAIFIAGPTASGKSALAVKIASDLDGVVINADSMQIYSDLSVITARPTAAEMADIEHRLYGTVDGAIAYSAADWRDAAMAEVEIAWGSSKLPILVGGTGMYFTFMLEGIADIPDIPEDIRARVRLLVKEMGAAQAHERLTMLDPETAERLEPNDSQRIARALEVVEATGKRLSDWHKENHDGPLKALDDAGCVHKVVLELPRDELYARVESRFDQMIEQGALDEVSVLLKRNLEPTLPVMKSLGVPELARYLRGDILEEEAVEIAKMQTRRFAKRQNTWFKNQFSHWNRLSAQYSESQYEKIIQNITKNLLTK